MTTPSLSVEAHSIASLEDCAAWPPEISRFYGASDASLPSWCGTGPYPFVSDGILPLLSELSGLPTSAYADSCDTTPRLADIFNLVLSTVADIRSLVAHYGPSRSVVPLVSTLLQVLVHMCAKGAIIMNETAFVRPRTTTPHRGEFDGVASFLACHSVEGFARDSSFGPDMVEECSSFFLPAVYPMSVDSGSGSASSSSGASSIDVPLDAHVIPGCGRHRYVLLPFLCVADINHIVDLMSSVACQRHVWGIPQPAVGFALSKSGTTATLVLSWVDLSTHNVHVVCPAPRPNSNRGAALGVFDFTSPSAALSFAQLVLRLSNEFAIVYDRAMAGCDNNRLDWRSDDIPSEGFHEQSRVARWVREVALSSGKSLSLPPTPPASPPKRVSSHSPDKSDAAMESKGPEKPELKPPKSHKSSSTFAALSAKGFDRKDPEGRADILTWLGDRAVYICALIARTTTDDAPEITKMVGFYDEMCGFRWPPTWDKNSPPSVDASLSEVRDLLLHQAVESRKKSSASPKQAGMKQEHQQFLEQHMSTLLSASVGACILHDQRAGVKINEAESRHRWDALLYHFYAVEGERASPYVLLEKKIHYSRNQAVDRMNTESFVEDQIKQADDYWTHCLDAQADARKLDKLLIRQAGTAAFQAQELLAVLEAFRERPEEYKKWVQRRSRREPREGICDAILFAALPGYPDLIPDAEFIREARAPPRDAPATVTDLDSVKQQLQNPFYVCTTESWMVPTQAAHEHVHQFQEHLLLPHFVAEYKKSADDEGKALNQGRMYLVSMVAFYSALGVDDYPFFALVTSGKVGAILMAWKSSKHDRTYLIERNVRNFDISSPIQAFHFATFLLRLRDDQEKLKVLVKLKLTEGGDQRRLRAKLRAWRKLTQHAEDEAQAEKVAQTA
ncbi:hypothetical protein B0H17DRAFT_1215917 [Mycena rosella]|uniref:Uncharacterized protein n=1 Tax=Mycena rosella TaxID=1033263 RepID=A0AAD7CDF0_MYCRO|nr:hypothetical protein B0H17DRAFT_1215917 [Mycena rosella]